MFKQQWTGNLSLKPKLRTYVLFKSMLEPEKYLDLHCNQKVIQIFTCFRCSVLPLAIEEGRRQNIDVSARLCKFCTKKVIEDEYHFLLECSTYSDLRKEYLPEESFAHPNLYKFVKLMRSNDSEEILNLCNFLYKAFKRRVISSKFLESN